MTRRANVRRRRQGPEPRRRSVEAPEIGDNDGPRQYFGPIRTDKHSCGVVGVEFLLLEKKADRDEELKHFAHQKLNENPTRRPSFLDWTRSSKRDDIDSGSMAGYVVPRKRQKVDEEAT